MQRTRPARHRMEDAIRRPCPSRRLACDWHWPPHSHDAAKTARCIYAARIRPDDRSSPIARAAETRTGTPEVRADQTGPAAKAAADGCGCAAPGASERRYDSPVRYGSASSACRTDIPTGPACRRKHAAARRPSRDAARYKCGLSRQSGTGVSAGIAQARRAGPGAAQGPREPLGHAAADRIRAVERISSARSRCRGRRAPLAFHPGTARRRVGQRLGGRSHRISARRLIVMPAARISGADNRSNDRNRNFTFAPV